MKDHSLPPHCHTIHFGREPENWSIKAGYEGDGFQISIFLAVKNSSNNAATSMWKYFPESRAEFDALIGEYARNGDIGCLKSNLTFDFTPRPVQIVVLNTRMMHAVGQCRPDRSVDARVRGALVDVGSTRTATTRCFAETAAGWHIGLPFLQAPHAGCVLRHRARRRNLEGFRGRSRRAVNPGISVKARFARLSFGREN